MCTCRLRVARKPAPKYIGPSKSLCDYGNSSYQLDLLSNLKAQNIHPVELGALFPVPVTASSPYLHVRMLAVHSTSTPTR